MAEDDPAIIATAPVIAELSTQFNRDIANEGEITPADGARLENYDVKWLNVPNCQCR